MLGAALGISASQYIDSVVAPAVADLNVQHSFAPVGLCLFNQFVATDSFAALPVEYFALQRSSRCNGGAMAAASGNYEKVGKKRKSHLVGIQRVQRRSCTKDHGIICRLLEICRCTFCALKDLSQNRSLEVSCFWMFVVFE